MGNDTSKQQQQQDQKKRQATNAYFHSTGNIVQHTNHRDPQSAHVQPSAPPRTSYYPHTDAPRQVTASLNTSVKKPQVIPRTQQPPPIKKENAPTSNKTPEYFHANLMTHQQQLGSGANSQYPNNVQRHTQMIGNLQPASAAASVSVPNHQPNRNLAGVNVANTKAQTTTEVLKPSTAQTLQQQQPKQNNLIVDNMKTLTLQNMPPIDNSHEVFNTQLKSKSLNDVRKSLVGNAYLSDVKFVLNGITIPAHKTFLVTSSSLFYETFEKKGESTMKIDNIEHETFLIILTYCYSDKIKITQDNVLRVLIAAHKLEVRQIVNICHGQIVRSINSETVFGILCHALDAKYEAIEKKCLEFIIANEAECFSSKSFYGASLDSLMRITNFCKFSSEKSKGIIEKWTTGPPAGETLPVQSPIITVDATKQPSRKQQRKEEFLARQKQQQNQQTKNGNQQQQKKKRSKSRSRVVTNSNSNSVPFTMIPDLMSYPVPPPAFTPISRFDNGTGFVMIGAEHNNYQPMKLNPIRPFAVMNEPKEGQLICLDDSDGEGGKKVIVKDDDPKKIVIILGSPSLHQTEFSRVDFVCKKAMLIHEIKFNENLGSKTDNVSLKIASFDHNNKSNDIHTRTINKKPGMPLNFVKFNRDPLKVFGGQKFYVKINFNKTVQARHVSCDGLTASDLIELRKDAETKPYFNCIHSLVVSDMHSG